MRRENFADVYKMEIQLFSKIEPPLKIVKDILKICKNYTMDRLYISIYGRNYITIA
jgi:hypothetical protein